MLSSAHRSFGAPHTDAPAVPCTHTRVTQVENCNLAVALGKELGLSLPGIGGVDIMNKNTKLILGFVWQLMRLQTLKVLKDVGHGVAPKDQDVLDWANAAVAATGKPGAIRISSFRDKAISNGCVVMMP